MSDFYFSSWLGRRSPAITEKIVAAFVGAIICSLSFFYPLCVLAAQPLNLSEDIFEQDRARYLDVEEKLLTYSKRSVQHLDNDIYDLAHYPLYPYLLRLKLERTMSIRTKREVKQFLEDFDGQPVSYGVRYKWLNYLAKNIISFGIGQDVSEVIQLVCRVVCIH